MAIALEDLKNYLQIFKNKKPTTSQEDSTLKRRLILIVSGITCGGSDWAGNPSRLTEGSHEASSRR